MPLSWNEIRSRALAFSKKWADAGQERSQAQSFLLAFFEVFGITDKRLATFEYAVKKYHGDPGYVDLFWPGVLLVEMKSRGRNLDRAYGQAMDYFPGIAERDLPRYVLVSDFEHFRLSDLVEDTTYEFKLDALHENVQVFGFIAGYQAQVIKPQDPINIEAAERMGRLHDKLKAVGYEGHALELYLVRLLFCLFAEDTSIFEKRQFQEFIELRTAEDGSDLAAQLGMLFYVLNTPTDNRLKNLDEQLAAFSYINGNLFRDTLPPAAFDSAMRENLLDLCGLDWGRISPAIFGSLFQSIMDKQARRDLGAHYTSEENILKLIKPLFLDELWAEFEKARRSSKRLQQFHRKLRSLRFLDPACGCGNFLVITYRELRLLELEVLRALHSSTQQVLDISQIVTLDVDQFYGIEIEDFPAQIAQVALWLTDHQMNLLVSQEFGNYFARIPLRSSPTVVNGNALQIEWNDVLPASQCAYVLGNPPFVGAKYMSDAQRQDTRAVFAGIKSAGLLDFVAAWYVKAARYISDTSAVPSRPAGSLAFSKTASNSGALTFTGRRDPIRCAFVSTNSIAQGEQVGVLWSWMLGQGVKIHFAHRTFAWSSEARGKAAVHCVIVGFGSEDVRNKTIFEYEDINGQPQAIKAKNINPYLVDAPDVVIGRRSRPLCDVPEMGIGNKPIDGGNYLFKTEEKVAFLEREPAAAPYFKRWYGSDEFINNRERWCLWLGDCSPSELRAMPEAMKRVEAVRAFRLASRSAPTRKIADTPTRFHVENMPHGAYLLVPRVSSERRKFIPIGFIPPDCLTSDSCLIVPDATLFHFGVLTSTMHNAWMRSVCGRLESRYRYSASIVYNNFPWPDASDKQQERIEEAAQGILDARAAHPGATMADLYDPLTTPPDLSKAHARLDRAVDAAYGYQGKTIDAVRVAFLLERYGERKANALSKISRRK